MDMTLAQSPAVARQPAAAARLDVQVQAIRPLADGILGFELAAPGGAALPPFAAGAHIDVHLPGGLIRQYSLHNDPRETHRYCIAVLHEPQGRGGSRAMHAQLRVGDRLHISRPRNHFPLAEEAARHLFLAGGIGITPILAMVRAAQARRQPFHLHYCSRTPERTAFLDELSGLVEAGHATLHHDGGDPRRGLDLSGLLREPVPGTHLYACGPGGFLDAVERAAARWPASARHSERFSAPGVPPAGDAAGAEAPFEVRLAGSGLVLTVPPGRSVVDVLQDHGVAVDVSCREGYCGTCMTRYLAGEPIHRDSVLDAEDREEFVMLCCCRARGGPLVLDL